MFRTSDGNVVRLEWATDRNAVASEREGRPIYDKVLRAFIASPGQAKSEVVHDLERYIGDAEVPVKVRHDIIARFPDAVKAFKANSEAVALGGTPLSQWPAIDIRMVAQLRELNVYTVEALAGLPDAGLQAIGLGARDLQARAKAWLDSAKGSADLGRYAAENQRMAEEISRLREELAETAAHLDEATAPEKRGPGRPRKGS